MHYSNMYLNLFDLIIVMDRANGPISLKRIAEQLRTSERQVSRWIRRLRDAGIVVKAVNGRSGNGCDIEPGALLKLDEAYLAKGCRV